MKTLCLSIQIIAAGIGGGLGWFLGGFDGFLNALIAVVIVDYITGVMCAIVEKQLSSKVGTNGIFKKILIFMLVGIAHIVDYYLIQSGNAIRTAIIFFYIANEGISILENTAAIGLPVPEKLRNILQLLKDRSSQNDN